MSDTTVSTEIEIILPDADSHSRFSNDVVANFLHHHLDEYGDALNDIHKCLTYVFERGGFLVVASQNNEVVGAVVVHDTGMQGYIPEHILVYIAVHREHRGEGFGKLLMQHAIAQATGDIALHVEPDNPAAHLYRKLGFTNKYLEMRLKK